MLKFIEKLDVEEGDLHVRRVPRTIQRQDGQTSLSITINFKELTMDDIKRWSGPILHYSRIEN